jgi:hypothetical protein
MQPQPESRPEATAELPRPDGWARPLTQDAIAWGGILFGIVLLAIALLGSVHLADWHFHQTRSMRLVPGGLGAALLFSASLVLPLRDHGVPPRLATVQDRGVSITGVLLPYSGARVVRKLAAGIALCAFAVGLVMAGLWMLIIVGLLAGRWLGLVVGATLLAHVSSYLTRPLRRAGRGWHLVLHPEGILHQEGQIRTFVPWAHIREVRAYTISAPGQQYGPPALSLRVDDPAAIITTVRPWERQFLRRWFTDIDISYPIDVLAVDPALAYAAMCYYTAHPMARVELRDHRGLQRLLRRDLR